MLKHKLLGATAAAEPVFIEDVFSTYLYTGNGSTQTITNGIDLAGEGGLVWIKKRAGGVNPTHHLLSDTNRGIRNYLLSSLANAQDNIEPNAHIASVSSTGFALGTTGSDSSNYTNATYASWTFRKAERFFDVVTYTGTGANRTVAHDLGVVPGCIIVKRTDTTGDWQVYHRSNTANPETDYLVLNSTAATVDDNTRWNDTLPTSTVFSLGTNATVNASGGTYVAYLFAHDPLGPSGDGSDGLIACGSYTGDGTINGSKLVNIGWEPQWLLIKNTSVSENWLIIDNMRGAGYDNTTTLFANLSQADATNGREIWTMDPQGFRLSKNNSDSNQSGNNYIYIAIRRGPMREPTSGAEVFSVSTRTGNGAANLVIGGVGFPPDFYMHSKRNETYRFPVKDRLRGSGPTLDTTSTLSETDLAGLFNVSSFDMNGVTLGSQVNVNESSKTYVDYFFRRAPGFFDVVAYTGNGVAGRTVSHNLGVAPEMMIAKKRSTGGAWAVYHSGANGGVNPENYHLFLEQTSGQLTDLNYFWYQTAPTETYFTLGISAQVNQNTATYIAYLFATLPGISKIGTYTGNGSSQTINCGFTGGARFVLIKRTDTADAWYVWDSARGIVAGNDPYLQLNSTAAEVTSTDHIDPANSGFTLATSFLGTNNSAGTYIYLAIA